MPAFKHYCCVVLVPCTGKCPAAGGNQLSADLDSSADAQQLGPLPLCAFGGKPKLIDVASWIRQQLHTGHNDNQWWLLEYCCYGHNIPILSDEALQEAFSFFRDEQQQQQQQKQPQQIKQDIAAAAAALTAPSKIYLWPVCTAPPWSISDYLNCRAAGTHCQQLSCQVVGPQPQAGRLCAAAVDDAAAAYGTAELSKPVSHAPDALAAQIASRTQQQVQGQSLRQQKTSSDYAQQQFLQWMTARDQSLTDAWHWSTALQPTWKTGCTAGAAPTAAADRNGIFRNVQQGADDHCLAAANSGRGSRRNSRGSCTNTCSAIATKQYTLDISCLELNAAALTAVSDVDSTGTAGQHDTVQLLLLQPGNRLVLLPAADAATTATNLALTPATLQTPMVMEAVAGMGSDMMHCCSMYQPQQAENLPSCCSSNPQQAAGIAVPAAQAAAAVNCSARLTPTQQRWRQQQQRLLLHLLAGSSNVVSDVAGRAGMDPAAAAAGGGGGDGFSTQRLQAQEQQLISLQGSAFSSMNVSDVAANDNAKVVQAWHRCQQQQQPLPPQASSMLTTHGEMASMTKAAPETHSTKFAQAQQQSTVGPPPPPLQQHQQQTFMQLQGRISDDGSLISDFSSLAGQYHTPQLSAVARHCSRSSNQAALGASASYSTRGAAAAVIGDHSPACRGAAMQGAVYSHWFAEESLQVSTLEPLHLDAKAAADIPYKATADQGRPDRVHNRRSQREACRPTTRTADGRYADPAKHKQRLQLMSATAAELFDGSMTHHWTINSHKSITCHLCACSITPYAPYHPDCIRKHFIRHHEDMLRSAGVDILSCAKGIQLGKRKYARLLQEKQEQQQQEESADQAATPYGTMQDQQQQLHQASLGQNQQQKAYEQLVHAGIRPCVDTAAPAVPAAAPVTVVPLPMVSSEVVSLQASTASPSLSHAGSSLSADLPHTHCGNVGMAQTPQTVSAIHPATGTAAAIMLYSERDTVAIGSSAAAAAAAAALMPTDRLNNSWPDIDFAVGSSDPDVLGCPNEELDELNSAELSSLNLCASLAHTVCEEVSTELGALWDEWRSSDDVIMTLSTISA